MPRVFEPLLRQNLSDDIAHRISQLIQKGSYESGTRLPTITHMARQFGVGAPTLREALKKLETLLDEMDRLLARASRSFDASALLNTVNLAFHRQIALASGNVVLHQILEVLSSLFQNEQRMILSIHGR